MHGARLGVSGLALAVLLSAPAPTLAARPAVRLVDLDERWVDPFLASESSRAVVFLFASVECPISNRYAPLVLRLYETFGPQGVSFWLIYPNSSDAPGAIREHLRNFGYPVHALRDPQHALAKLAGVTVTPEAAVYDRVGSLAYRGRLDDRYVSLGLERQAPARQDLADALRAVLAGRAVRDATTPAVGCFIADFAVPDQ